MSDPWIANVCRLWGKLGHADCLPGARMRGGCSPVSGLIPGGRIGAALGQQRTQTEATANLNRTVLNRSLQLTFSTAAGGVHSHFCAASFGTDVRHVSENGLPSASCTAPIRHRMPVILPLEAFDFWLDCANVDAVTAAALLTAPREDFFEADEISTAVNRVANDRPALLEPIAQSPTPARFTPTMPATAEAQMSAPAKPVKKPKKDERLTSLF